MRASRTENETPTEQTTADDVNVLHHESISEWPPSFPISSGRERGEQGMQTSWSCRLGPKVLIEHHRGQRSGLRVLSYAHISDHGTEPSRCGRYSVAPLINLWSKDARTCDSGEMRRWEERRAPYKKGAEIKNHVTLRHLNCLFCRQCCCALHMTSPVPPPLSSVMGARTIPLSWAFFHRP